MISLVYMVHGDDTLHGVSFVNITDAYLWVIKNVRELNIYSYTISFREVQK